MELDILGSVTESALRAPRFRSSSFARSVRGKRPRRGRAAREAANV
jgi:hypothetical protein